MVPCDVVAAFLYIAGVTLAGICSNPFIADLKSEFALSADRSGNAKELQQIGIRQAAAHLGIRNLPLPDIGPIILARLTPTYVAV